MRPGRRRFGRVCPSVRRRCNLPSTMSWCPVYESVLKLRRGERIQTGILLLPTCQHEIDPSDLLIWSFLNHLAVVPSSLSQVSHADLSHNLKRTCVCGYYRKERNGSGKRSGFGKVRAGEQRPKKKKKKKKNHVLPAEISPVELHHEAWVDEYVHGGQLRHSGRDFLRRFV